MPGSPEKKIHDGRYDMVIHKERDIAGAEAAAECVVEMHRRLVDFLTAGQTLSEIDEFIGQELKAMRSRSCFIRYRIPGQSPFPSHSCLSVNECVVHGTHLMSDEPLVEGDLISIDVGVRHNGWIGDAAWTYAINECTDEARRLMDTGKESLRRGIDAMQPGRPLADWASAVQEYVEDERGFSLVRGLGGHGYGKSLHGPPFISNVLPTRPGEWPDAERLFVEGLLVAVEPMINAGGHEVESEPGHWPIRTVDGSLSVHYEADVLVTAHGPRNLTAGLAELPDVVG